MRGLTGLVAGLWLPYLQHLVGASVGFVMLFLVVVAVCFHTRIVLFTTLLIGYAVSTAQISSQLSNWRAFESPFEDVVSGTIEGLPRTFGETTEFLFRASFFESRPAGTALIRLRCFRCRYEIQTGAQWVFRAKIRPARSILNFHGFDRERWLFANRISALGSVISGARDVPPGRAGPDLRRARLAETLTTILADHSSLPIIKTLAIADRRDLDAHSWMRYQATGTAHLLAISGLHIGLAAGLGLLASRLFMLFIPMKLLLRHARGLSWSVGLGLAWSYAALSGFGVSTQRALLMLLCLAVCSLSGLKIASGRTFALAMCVVMVVQPMAPLQAGFWLSFGAIAALLLITARTRLITARWKQMVTAQCAISVLTIPLVVYWIGKLAPVGILANLIAIPWLSLTVVPPVLGGLLLLHLDSFVAEFLIILAAQNVLYLDHFLDFVVNVFGPAMTIVFPGWAVAVVWILGAVLIVLPRGVPMRLLAASCFVPALLMNLRNLPANSLTVLDTGQGLSVLTTSGKQLMIYDSGPGDGQTWDLVGQVIHPAILAKGASLDLSVTSHADLDHAGGLSTLTRLYPDAVKMASMDHYPRGVYQCRRGTAWRWGNSQYSVLHPSAGLPYLGNDSSCVISIDWGEFRILLPGDVSDRIEKRLIYEGIGHHDILLLAHHGSTSSNSIAFLNTINPQLSLVSAGHNNRYNMPTDAVTKRMHEQDLVLLATAGCGAMEIVGDSSKITSIRSARRARAAPWHWPAEASCP